MKSLSGTLKKATIEMLILKLLWEGDKYGYQITQELKTRSDGLYTVLEGSMYPILYRLLDDGCISTYEEMAGPRLKRHYYRLEAPGVERLQNQLNEFDKYIPVIQFLAKSQKGESYGQYTKETAKKVLP